MGIRDHAAADKSGGSEAILGAVSASISYSQGSGGGQRREAFETLGRIGIL